MIILLTYGTRPEYLKIKPLIKELKKRNIKHYSLFTGQHQNIAPHDADFKFEMSKVVSNNRLDSIIGNIISEGDKLYDYNKNNDFTHVLVQGDTTSAMIVALSAFHHGKQIIHLEAGLRSYDNMNPFPEEVNRKIISQLANIHLCPTRQSLQNLEKEQIQGLKYVVGNTVLDNLLDYKDRCEYTDTILVTLHRRENHSIINHWFEAINELAKKYSKYKFVFPLHPNPEIQKYRHILTNIDVVNPLDHADLLELLISTKLVITDSGGLQEECSFLNKKCLICREVTERPEALGYTNFIVGKPENLERLFLEHINTYAINFPCPFGDGKSASKIVDLLFGNHLICEN